MAYISHSPFHSRSIRERAERLSPTLLIRSAVVALAAAAAILALSEGYSTSAATGSAAAKADRLAPMAATVGGKGRMTVDAAAQTTIVERGEVAGINPASPMAAEGK